MNREAEGVSIGLARADGAGPSPDGPVPDDTILLGVGGCPNSLCFAGCGGGCGGACYSSGGIALWNALTIATTGADWMSDALVS